MQNEKKHLNYIFLRCDCSIRVPYDYFSGYLTNDGKNVEFEYYDCEERILKHLEFFFFF